MSRIERVTDKQIHQRKVDGDQRGNTHQVEARLTNIGRVQLYRTTAL